MPDESALLIVMVHRYLLYELYIKTGLHLLYLFSEVGNIKILISFSLYIARNNCNMST